MRVEDVVAKVILGAMLPEHFITLELPLSGDNRARARMKVHGEEASWLADDGTSLLAWNVFQEFVVTGKTNAIRVTGEIILKGEDENSRSDVAKYANYYLVIPEKAKLMLPQTWAPEAQADI